MPLSLPSLISDDIRAVPVDLGSLNCPRTLWTRTGDQLSIMIYLSFDSHRRYYGFFRIKLSCQIVI